MRAYHVKITELIKAVSPLSERFGFCRSNSKTQLSAIIMHLRKVSPQCI